MQGELILLPQTSYLAWFKKASFQQVGCFTVRQEGKELNHPPTAKF